MKIEAGKYYRTRGGQVFGPMVPHPEHDTNYPWCLVFSEPEHSWDEDGRWFMNGREHLFDLVAEVHVSDTPQVNTTKTAKDELVEKAALETRVAELEAALATARVEELEAALATARREGMEEAAKIAEGDVCFERYRTWPWWKNMDGSQGNIGNDSYWVKHCDRIAAAIRAASGEGKPWLRPGRLNKNATSFFNRLGRITEYLDLPVDATAQRIVEAIQERVDNEREACASVEVRVIVPDGAETWTPLEAWEEAIIAFDEAFRAAIRAAAGEGK